LTSTDIGWSEIPHCRKRLTRCSLIRYPALWLEALWLEAADAIQSTTTTRVSSPACLAAQQHGRLRRGRDHQTGCNTENAMAPDARSVCVPGPMLAWAKATRVKPIAAAANAKPILRFIGEPSSNFTAQLYAILGSESVMAITKRRFPRRAICSPIVGAGRLTSTPSVLDAANTPHKSAEPCAARVFSNRQAKRCPTAAACCRAARMLSI
jgi:hypothetical protein